MKNDKLVLDHIIQATRQSGRAHIKRRPRFERLAWLFQRRSAQQELDWACWALGGEVQIKPKTHK